MSVARTWAVALAGLHGEMVEIEADVTTHTPDFKIIGLPDKTLGEASRRVVNACENAELELPPRRITVNLSPAGLPKQGSGFDLGIAVAALAVAGAIPPASIARTVHIGELGLDGRLRPVAGVLPAVQASAQRGFERVVVPVANHAEAALVPGIEVIAAVSLPEVARRHGADVDVPAHAPARRVARRQAARASAGDLRDVVGQPEAVETLTVAAAGGHHLLLSGPPGAGKSMLASMLPGILPPLDDEAALEVAALRSLAGEAVEALVRLPPFEAPHHSITLAALVGGGSRVSKPGMISRASRGVLMIDEAGEVRAGVLDALRQPLERGRIDIHRAGFTASYPARFQLVVLCVRLDTIQSSRRPRPDAGGSLVMVSSWPCLRLVSSAIERAGDLSVRLDRTGVLGPVRGCRHKGMHQSPRPAKRARPQRCISRRCPRTRLRRGSVLSVSIASWRAEDVATRWALRLD